MCGINSFSIKERNFSPPPEFVTPSVLSDTAVGVRSLFLFVLGIPTTILAGQRPTSAFKDFGARFMANVLGFLQKKNDIKTTIVTATSGDTGGAVASAFHNVKDVNVFILYPKGRVSDFQEKQIAGLGDNIRAIE